jgi:uncharacterized protein (TIGR03435 family)
VPLQQQFEVASIRPSGGNHVNGFRIHPGGRIVATGCRLQYLIMLAFNLQYYQVVGGPKWVDWSGDVGFDIQAIAPADSQPTAPESTNNPDTPNEEMRQMLQSLLIDRFHLKYHRVTKDGPVFLLVKGNKNPKLQAPKDAKAGAWAGAIGGGYPTPEGLQGINISMTQFAARLSDWMKRPVLDQTGIQGSYDFEYNTGISDSDAETIPSILLSIKALGLNLKPSKGPVETLVIDHVEMPTQN